MPRKPNGNLQKHTLNLRAGDVEFLQQAYAARGVKASDIIRRLVAHAVDKIRQQASPLEIEVDDI